MTQDPFQHIDEYMKGLVTAIADARRINDEIEGHTDEPLTDEQLEAQLGQPPDEPLGMRRALKLVYEYADAVDTELIWLRGFLWDVMRLAYRQHKQRDAAVQERDAAYEVGWQAALRHPDTWQWLIDTLIAQDQPEAAAHMKEIVERFLRDEQESQAG